MDAKCLIEPLGICFETASKNGTEQIFGIADFLATVAIFLVAYSLSDAKYRFRSAVTSFSYRLVLFIATLGGGVSLLAINIVFSLALPVPRAINNPFFFQIAIAAVFIGVISYWMFRAFVRPPVFTRSNAIPFAQEVFRGIADGDEGELAACVHEVGRSARELVKESSRTDVRRALHAGGFEDYTPTSAQVASDVLLLIGDRRFCRMVAKRMPWVAAEIFRAAAEYDADVRRLAQFARNVSDEFFADTESAIHHEDDGYYSGLIGYLKPVSSVMFGNSKLIERLSSAAGSPLQLLWLNHRQWEIKSWKTYNKSVLLFLDDKLQRKSGVYVTTDLYQVLSGFKSVCIDLYLVNDMDESAYYGSLPCQKFHEVVDFLSETIALLNKHQVFASRFPSKRDGRFYANDIYDHIVDVAVNLFSSAGAVDTSDFRNWTIQHNILWSELMAELDESKAQDVFRKRLQRVILLEVRDMSRLPSFVTARLLSVCLNVLGLRVDRASYRPRATRAFKRLVLAWTKRNFLTLYAKYPSVAEACIGGTIAFDKERNRLVKTYSAYFDREPVREYLELDPPDPSI